MIALFSESRGCATCAVLPMAPRDHSWSKPAIYSQVDILIGEGVIISG